MTKPFKLTAYEPNEFQIHCGVADTLRKFAKPLVLWFAVANQGHAGGLKRGEVLKRMGVRAGVSDIVILHEGRTLFLELKTRTGCQSSQQLAFMEMARLAGAEYEVARSINEAIGIMQERGLLTQNLITEAV